MRLTYLRTFNVAAAHFNGAKPYRQAAALFGEERPHPPSDVESAVNALTGMAREMATTIHGHNFKITIQVDASEMTPEGFVVSDVALIKLTDAWQETNLSLHADFWPVRLRATTENMALVLAHKVADIVRRGTECAVRVRVEETPEQVAEVALVVPPLAPVPVAP